MESDVLLPASSPVSLGSLIDALGTDHFEVETLRYLNETSGTEHYTVYRMRGRTPELLGGASIRGLHASRGRRSQAQGRERSWTDLFAARTAATLAAHPVVMREAVQAIEDPALQVAFDHFRIVDRLMLCGRRLDDVYAISLLRSDDTGQFDDPQLDRLNAAAEVLIAACAKHAVIHWDRVRAARGFDSVETIEERLRTSDWKLTVRETQVSARILFGISAIGIALDLGLGQETIATYRKRLYTRLVIGSRHELFQKYLTLL